MRFQCSISRFCYYLRSFLAEKIDVFISNIEKMGTSFGTCLTLVFTSFYLLFLNNFCFDIDFDLNILFMQLQWRMKYETKCIFFLSCYTEWFYCMVAYDQHLNHFNSLVHRYIMRRQSGRRRKRGCHASRCRGNQWWRRRLGLDTHIAVSSTWLTVSAVPTTIASAPPTSQITESADLSVRFRIQFSHPHPSTNNCHNSFYFSSLLSLKKPFFQSRTQPENAVAALKHD